jgi:hypothetical protein
MVIIIPIFELNIIVGLLSVSLPAAPQRGRSRYTG